MQNFQYLAALYLQGWQSYVVQTNKPKVSTKPACWVLVSYRMGVGRDHLKGPAKSQATLLTLGRKWYLPQLVAQTALPLPGAGNALSSAFSQASQSLPPLQCRPLLLLPLILFKKKQGSVKAAACHPSAIWPHRRTSWRTSLPLPHGCGCHPPFPSLACSSAPLAQELGFPVRQTWALWIVFICWRSGVKTLSVNCILILSAVCIYFPLPPSPGLIYDSPFPLLPIVTMTGSPQAPAIHKTCLFKMNYCIGTKFPQFAWQG